MEITDLLERRVARYVDRVADWDAFADARVEGFRRAQHRFIGTGASGKGDVKAIPAEHFTLSIMYVPPGQGNAAHTHPVEEAFFILEERHESTEDRGRRFRRELLADDGADERGEMILALPFRKAARTDAANGAGIFRLGVFGSLSLINSPIASTLRI